MVHNFPHNFLAVFAPALFPLHEIYECAKVLIGLFGAQDNCPGLWISPKHKQNPTPTKAILQTIPNKHIPNSKDPIFV
jgi:hypothetical protein